MRVLPKLIVGAMTAAAVAAGVAPWRLPDAAVGQALAAHLGRDTGFDVKVSGPVTFKLLPRPRVRAANLSIADRDGAVAVDAPAVLADIDIPDLLMGRWRVTSATLITPTMSLDLDRLAAQHKPIAPAPIAWPTQVHVRSGLLRTKSSASLADLIVTGIDATVAWPGHGDALVLSGSSTWRGTTVVFAGSLDRPDQALSLEGSAAALQIDSPIFSLAASGHVAGGTQDRFAGHVAASTSALQKVVRELDGFPVGITARRAQISGDLVARPHDLSLSNAQLKLDRARFEGTLALRREGNHNLVEGTLATDLLDVDALLGRAIDRKVVEGLYGRRFDPESLATDVDIRVSAGTTRIGRLSLEDAAFAALLRSGRLELTLDEAGAYGGLVKARVIANLARGGLDAHAEVATQHVDLDLLSEALSDRDRVGGALTGQAVLDGSGASLRDVVADLDGKGQITIDNGRLAGLALGQMLRRLGRRLPIEAEPKGQPTTFDKATWAFSVDKGTVKIPEGKLTAPGLQMSFGAQTALADGHTDVHAVAAQTDGGGLPIAGGERLPFDMRGTWDGPFVLVAHVGAVTLPALAFPLLGPPAASPR